MKEIDLCADMADFFGPTAHLGAQSSVSAIDLVVGGPSIKAEVKYLRNRVAWTNKNQSGVEKGVKKDWDWLLLNDGPFHQKAWVVFFPATTLYSFQECISVGKSHELAFSKADFAPFVHLVEVKVLAGGSQKLGFRAATNIPRLSTITMPGGKCVRVDLVGSAHHAVWCAIYTRITGAERDALQLPANAMDAITALAVVV